MAAVVLASCCAAGLVDSNGCSLPSAQAEEPSSDDPDGQACSVVASIPYWDQARAIKSFKKNVDLIHHISVFWYNLDSKGNVQTYKRANESRELISFAHKHGVKVLALIANLPDDEREGEGGTWDPARVGHVIRSRERRAAHIADLMALTRRMGFDGIYIDYEALPRAYRDDFTLFIQELGAALHAENKLLAVALHPKTSEDNPREENGSQAQDWNALHPHIDQLHFMTYSQHTADSDPGPVASFGWVERVLRHAVENRKVPRAKTFMGVPLYAEEWQKLESGRFQGRNTDSTFEYVQTRKREHQAREQWSAKHKSPNIELTDKNGKTHIIWYENERSSEWKLALGAGLGVCNVSLWRIGGEDPGIWQLLRDKRHIVPSGGVGGNRVDVRRGPGSETADHEGDDPAEDSPDDDVQENEDQDDDDAENDDPEQDGAEAEEDGEEESSSLEFDQTLVWRLSGRSKNGYPRLSGEVGTELEHYEQFAIDDPAYWRNNWVANIDFEQAFEITPRLVLNSDVRLVLESDGEDNRFYSNYPYEGIYIGELSLHYEAAHYAIVAGKYEPAARIRGYAPIYFGNYSVDLNLDGRLGAGASITLEREGLGKHTLTGHSVYRDTWALSGELLSGRPRDRSAAVGHAGWSPDFLVTLHGGTNDTSLTFNYTLGTGMQKREDLPDEHIYFLALYGMLFWEGFGDLELSIDVMQLRNAKGAPEDRSSLLLGVAYSGTSYSIGAAYSIRFVRPRSGMAYHPEEPDAGRTDHIVEIVARYDMGNFVSIESSYQTLREYGVRENSFGIALKCSVDWLVY